VASMPFICGMLISITTTSGPLIHRASDGGFIDLDPAGFGF